jgi:ribokinase
MIVIAGSANLDFVVRAPHIPAPGETVLGSSFATYPGGKGANQAVACARAGDAASMFVAAVGQDDFAKPIEASLQGGGVRLHLHRLAHVPTGTAFICVDDQAENAITVAPGANAELRPEHGPDLQGVSHLLMQLETPMATVQALAQRAHNQGVQVVLNAAPAQVLPAELLDALDILIVNQGELQAIAGQHNSIAQAMQALAVPTVVVTLGARGCCAKVGEHFIVQAAFPVQAVDTTGAGDTFCGVLVASLSQGADMTDALRHASAASALACTVAGAQSSIPTRAAVDQFLNQAEKPSAAQTQALYQFCGLTPAD